MDQSKSNLGIILIAIDQIAIIVIATDQIQSGNNQIAINIIATNKIPLDIRIIYILIISETLQCSYDIDAFATLRCLVLKSPTTPSICLLKSIDGLIITIFL